MYKRILVIIVITLVVVATLVGLVWKNQGMFSAREHTWSLYTDPTRGFSIKYPSDILVPDGHTSTTTVMFALIGGSSYSVRPMYVWVYPTTATDIFRWMDDQNQGKGDPILKTSAYATTTIDNVTAIVIEDHSFSFIHDDKVWNILLDNKLLAPSDIELIKQSFHFIK